VSQTLAGGGDGSADYAPRIAYDSAGRANLVWVKGRVAHSADPDDAVDQLYFATYTSDTWSTPVLAVEATAIQAPRLLVDAQDNLVVLWLARSDAGLDVWYAVYDRTTDLWSDPILFTHDRDAQGDYDAVMDSTDTLRVVLTGREIVTSTHHATTTQMAALAAAQTIVYPALGQVRPAEQQHTLRRDLTLTTLVVSPTNPAPGTTATLTATAHNSGDLAVTGGQVALYDGDPNGGGTQIGVAQPLVSPFRAATTATVSVQWDVPSALSSHAIYAVVDPANSITESIESNNQISLTVVLLDLDVRWVRADWFSDTITVTANVHSGGASPVTVPFTVALRTDDPLSGPEIAGEQVAASLSPGESVTLTLTITDPAAILTGTHTAWVVADVADAVSEADEANNTAFSALNVAPDLTLTAADIAGNGPIVVTVHNTGFISATDVVMAVRADGLTGTLLYSDTIGSLGPHRTAPVTLTTLAPDRCMLYVQLDPANEIPENDESNNLAVREVELSHRVYLPLVLCSY
jgi:hypothetical protein